jgi:hypothetical protein
VITGPLYPAAHAVARRLEEHFRRSDPHAAESLAADADAIESLVGAAFWASLQREEGYPPEISLALLPPGRASRPLLFASPLPLGPRALARLAPAVERPGIHLGVWRSGPDLVVWGTTRAVPIYCFVVEVLAPGLLVVKHRLREDSGKFRNVAVFEGEQVKVLAPQGADVAQHPALLKSLVAPQIPGPDDLMLRLAVSMRAHKRGGTLLVVPAGGGAWRESIVRPITYAVDPPFTELAELARGAHEDDPGSTALGRAVDAVAGLTAVDGATLLNDRYDLLAFGVKIGRPQGRPRVEQVVVTEPIENGVAEVVAPVQLGGTRHISAAQFAQDQQDAVALVASQDGRFTIFAWCAREGMVHAHRVESLLL